MMGLGGALIIMGLIPHNSIEPSNAVKKWSNHREFEFLCGLGKK